ncbi:hypothetical protein [Ilumatobacter sp.]|uniref:hypothetical protein n=1 Tax=Ilumatobacter sp. TaxID=1967498 RepID=UPI003AF42899
MTIGRRLPALAPDIELADFDTEIVALVPDRRRAVHLDSAHAIVVDSCRRGDDVDAVVDEIVRATGQERTAVETWLEGAVRELARLGITAPAGPA